MLLCAYNTSAKARIPLFLCCKPALLPLPSHRPQRPQPCPSQPFARLSSGAHHGAQADLCRWQQDHWQPRGTRTSGVTSWVTRNPPGKTAGGALGWGVAWGREGLMAPQQLQQAQAFSMPAKEENAKSKHFLIRTDFNHIVIALMDVILKYKQI